MGDSVVSLVCLENISSNPFIYFKMNSEDKTITTLSDSNFYKYVN